MYQTHHDISRRSASDIRLRTSLVTWLGIGLSLFSLACAYTFYMKYRADADELRAASAQDELAAMIRAKGLVCTRVCAATALDAGGRSVVTCGIEQAPRSCARTQNYAFSITLAPH
jgi:hypothetical protein